MAYHSNQLYSSPTTYPVNSDYDHVLNEVAVKMAASQLSRQSRYGYHPTPGRWSGRIEKPRSSHTSPAFPQRQRAYSSTRPAQAQMYSLHGLKNYSPTHQVTHRAPRPFSWHSSNSQQVYASPMSNTTSPDAHNYLPTPPMHTTTQVSSAQSFQLPAPLLYHGLPYLEKSTGPASITSDASYSGDTYPSSSPNWHYVYDGQAPIITNSTHISSVSPPSQLSWYETACSQLPAQPILQPTPLPPITIQPSLASLIGQQPLYSPMISAPEADVEEEDDSEVLVGLGLYDRPEELQLDVHSSKLLKLVEAWQPPETTSDEEDDDSSEEDDDEEVRTPDATQSWFS